MGMNRACPIVPPPVVPPLYQPSNSASSDSNRSSPLKADTTSPSPIPADRNKRIYTHHKSRSLPTYITQCEKVPSILKNKGKFTNSRNKKVNPEPNTSTYDEDELDVACEYERRNLNSHRNSLHEHNEDHFQPNIPGTVTENCNHSTQIFVKVMNQQPQGSSHRICNIKEEKNGGVTIYMSKPFKEYDNINNPKQFEDNNQNQQKRQKESQNLQKHPPEPPKVPRRSKRKVKSQSKKSYTAPHSPPKESQEIQHASGTSKITPAVPSVEGTEISIHNYEHDNRNNDSSAVVIGGKSEISIESSKLPYKESEYPLGYSNKEHGRYSSVGIQVSPSPQYRLRFLPICGCTSYENSDWQCGTQRIRSLLRFTGRWMFSQCGLGIILFIWALLGAAAFRATEGPQEEEVARQLTGKQNELVIELARDLRILEKEEPGWRRKIEFYVEQHKEMLLEAVSSGYGEGGFGAPVPRTTLGRMSAVIFSAIGIPLHLLLVLNIGMLVAVKLQFLATRWQPGTSFPKALFQCCCQYKKNKAPTPVQRDSHIPEPQMATIEINNVSQCKSVNPSLSPPRWLKWFPAVTIILYYVFGVLVFGVGRAQPFAACLLFPLDFTAAGGVGLTSGAVRTCYAIYLEGAVTLAAIAVSILQVSASRGLTDLGLKLGLLTNS
ncbi:hypothetical protein C0J52_14887 [Blattella germanica]|nr:hypothetical protein C0J52_14887 [Blattella germanica]